MIKGRLATDKIEYPLLGWTNSQVRSLSAFLRFGQYPSTQQASACSHPDSNAAQRIPQGEEVGNLYIPHNSVHQTPIAPQKAQFIQETNFGQFFLSLLSPFLAILTKPQIQRSACLPCVLSSADAYDGKKTRGRGKAPELNCISPPSIPSLDRGQTTCSSSVLAGWQLSLNSGVMCNVDGMGIEW